MKRIFTAVLILSALTLTACTPSLKLVGEQLYDKRTDITYTYAPICYEPIMLAEEPFAQSKDLHLELYEIDGLDTELWISEPYEGIGGVWYNADKVTLPTLTEFDTNILHVCQEKVITTSLGTITDKADLDKIIAAFVDGEPTTIVTEGTSYKLKFASDKYPGIYYNLLYVEGDDGENYIYDRSTKTCVNVGDVLLKYMPR